MKLTPEENASYIGTHAEWNGQLAEYFVQRDGVQVKVSFKEYLEHMAKLVRDRVHAARSSK